MYVVFSSGIFISISSFIQKFIITALPKDMRVLHSLTVFLITASSSSLLIVAAFIKAVTNTSNRCLGTRLGTKLNISR